ncbi:DEAD/DEAH box helicase [Arsenicicoccus sp. oral taxon 190]|uniref:DEAD/DEAH box helicase n=1 Tax=Arsenicicoccus sp. oral taxon 190 TaxID=1658671 RepID=UPI00067A2FCE|nr:DEAD/DEAH box helicase [Arsenicicoccus sp. oral taxon 190]AKT50312.1 DEAD/DEAH box helicase [Arsenicicoccus sp. oral taxon 190]
MTLTDLLPPPADRTPDGFDADAVYTAFVEWTLERGIELYPAQDEALLELATGANVILATPTGSGKSMVALGAHLMALAGGRRTFYTAPIKALVSEKFFALCEAFGADNVGMMTGDAAVNAGAPIICCTAEVLANIALRQGDRADVGQVVMDEFHFYSEPDRGWAWQVPILTLPQAQFLLMSATLGDTSFFVDDLQRRTGRDTVVVSSATRPIPLTFEWAMQPVHETIELLLMEDKAPVYVVHFTQAAALERAQALMSLNVTTKDEKKAIAAELKGFRFAKGFGATLQRLVRHGIGVHHAGMLPKYRRLVETLAQQGLLKVICGTDTLGVGINVPIRTVLLTGLTKFDGSRQRVLKAREFHQIAGRAGRAGFDTAGTVVVQAPDHVIENHKALLKAGDDPKKQRKVQRKKPPEGFVSWTQEQFDRIVTADPEPLQSRLHVSHGMLLNLIQREGDPFPVIRDLLRDNHSDARTQARLQRRAIEIYRSLRDAGIVTQLDEPDETGRRIYLTEDLQRGFALNQPLSTFALAAFELLDPESPTYALDVVSIIEATLDDPRAVLMAQQFKARGEAVQEMKMDGIEYDERMELLEEITWPKPLADLLEQSLHTYRETHPWISEDDLSPKSVVRDLFERVMTFGQYVAHYQLSRSEGVVLRYLSDAYKALRQTVPATYRTDELTDLIEWLGEVVRQTDSSLLEEWEALTSEDEAMSAEALEALVTPLPGGNRPLSANERALRVMVRSAMFRKVELVALRRWIDLAELDAAALELAKEARADADLPAPDTEVMDVELWQEAIEDLYAEYPEISTGPDARGPALLLVEKEPGRWLVDQILDDPDGDHDWRIQAEVDLDATDAAGELVLITTNLDKT